MVLKTMTLVEGQPITFYYGDRTFRGTLAHTDGQWSIKLQNNTPGEPQEIPLFAAEKFTISVTE